MPVTPSRSTFHGLSLLSLKEKAAVHQDASLSLIDWINQAHKVYLAAVEADNRNLKELAYVEYFKAAGILQIILNHPGFKTLKVEQPADYRVYLEIAPKVLASTTRAKELAQIIDLDRHEKSRPTSPTINASKPRPIAGGISSRIKSLEAAGLARCNSSSTSSIPNQLEPAESCLTPHSRPLPSPPHGGTSIRHTQSSFVSTALEAESAVRSGSAPPELTIDCSTSAYLPSSLRHDVEPARTNVNGSALHHSQSPSGAFEHTLRSLRSPSEFAQVFPVLEDLTLEDSISSWEVTPSYPELPSVPKTLPSATKTHLPPPPEPFIIPLRDGEKADSDHLENDTTLGAGLNVNSSPAPALASDAPPPYLDLDCRSQSSPLTSKPPLLSRSHAIRGHSRQPSLANGQISPQSPKRSLATSYSPDAAAFSLPALPENANEVLPAVLIDYFRKAAGAGFETKILLLDLREREEFESCRIKSTDVVCIEPLVLTKNGGRGVSSQDIEQSLVISPKKERSLFEQRQTFDYVVVYDKRSVQFPIHRPLQDLLHSQDPAETPNKLLMLLYLAIHREEYVKPLKRPPILLSGGIEGWIKVSGEAGIVGKGSSASRRPSEVASPNGISSLNGIPVTFRQPLQQDESPQMGASETQEDSSQIKKARRQVSLVQGESSTPDATKFIARSVADLTRPGPNPNSTHQMASFKNQPNHPQLRQTPPLAFAANHYGAPGTIASPITLPQQTLQRPKSSQTYDAPGNPQPNGPLSSAYSTTAPIHLSSTYHQRPPPPPPPLGYSAHPSSFLVPRQAESGYSNYLAPSLKPTIQYPQLQSGMTPRPLQPPPPALTPGAGTTLLSAYYPVPLSYGSLSPRLASYSRDFLAAPHQTPPMTPYSPNRHGAADIYFNPSFDDGQVGLTGLKNLGNTCYMNSTLQCISATIPLARFFKDGSYKRCINRSNPLGTRGQLAESVAELVRVLWSAQYTFVSPVTFREAICRFAPQFRGSDQHDAQEFLAFLLDGLHEDLNLVLKKPPPIDMTEEREAELESLPTQLASAKEWEVYKRRDNSVIVELFQGQYRSRLQCLTCGTTSTTYNTFMYLSLPVPTKRGVSKMSLTQCLDAFLKEEIMEKDDAWNCPKCKTRRKATKRLSLARLPPVLLIHLKRFSFKGPFSDKLETFVQYPVYGLDLTAYVPPPLNEFHQPISPVGSCTIYDLYAVCNHFGSLSSGHYTAFVRSQKEWYNIGDSRVSKADEKSVKARSAYLLCFRRRD